jgi:protein ATS1
VRGPNPRFDVLSGLETQTAIRGYHDNGQVMDTGTLLGLGSNGSGQLGNSTTKDCSRPTLALFHGGHSNVYPIHVAGGGNHTLILFSDGSIWSAGIGEDGVQAIQPAENSKEYMFRNLKVESASTSRYKLCSATWTASFLVTKENQIEVIGTGFKGVLGLGNQIEHSVTNQVVKDFPLHGTEITDIASSMGHTAAVLSDGSVYGWGNGRKGQLGDPGVVWTPRKIKGIEFKAVRVVCGREFTVVVGDPSKGQFTVLGADKHQIRTSAPTSLIDWIDVQASWGSIHVLRRDGSLLSWGRNDHGQLSTPIIPKLRAIAAGSEHAVAITADGAVISWGWGEHGNCGLPVDADGDVKGHWNTLDLDHLESNKNVSLVGAGCATSWIWTESRGGAGWEEDQESNKPRT